MKIINKNDLDNFDKGITSGKSEKLIESLRQFIEKDPTTEFSFQLNPIITLPHINIVKIFGKSIAFDFKALTKLKFPFYYYYKIEVDKDYFDVGEVVVEYAAKKKSQDKWQGLVCKKKKNVLWVKEITKNNPINQVKELMFNYAIF